MSGYRNKWFQLVLLTLALKSLKVIQLYGIIEQERTYKQHVRFSETDMKSNSSARQALLLAPLSQINHARTSKQGV